MDQNDGLFLTAGGLMVSASHGEHAFTLERLMNQIGAEAMNGMLIFVGDGNWVQEGNVPLTDEQAETLCMLADRYPEGGVSDALRAARAHFGL